MRSKAGRPTAAPVPVLLPQRPNRPNSLFGRFIVGADISPIYLGDSAVGATKPAPGPRVGRPALDRNELRLFRERLKSLGRPMDIWVTLYRHELLPKHPLQRLQSAAGQSARYVRRTYPVDFALPGTAPTRRESGGAQSGTPTRLIALGMYIWDYWASKPVPLELMRHQCELGLKWLKEQRIQEIIFLGNNVLDVGIPCAEFVRDWIAKVRHQPV